MGKPDNKFGFDFEVIGTERETIPSFKVYEAEATLRVRKSGVAEGVECRAHPLVDQAAEQGHAVRRCHAVADNHGRWG